MDVLLFGGKDILTSKEHDIAEIVAAEIIYHGLRVPFLIDLYKPPLEKHRVTDLGVTDSIETLCGSIFAVISTAQLDVIMRALYLAMVDAWIYVVLKSTQSKKWSRNDYALIKKDFKLFKESFKKVYGVDEEWMDSHPFTCRAQAIIDMANSPLFFRCATPHYTMRNK